MQKQRVTSAKYDITGHRIGRVLKQNFIFRLLPIGNFGGGPNLKFITELLGLHTFARLYYALKIRLEKPAGLLARVLRIAPRRPG